MQNYEHQTAILFFLFSKIQPYFCKFSKVSFLDIKVVFWRLSAGIQLLKA